MGLYEQIDQQINTANFLNDTILFMDDQITWEQLVAEHRLEPESETQHAESMQFWLDQVGLAPTQPEKDIVALQMHSNLDTAYKGCDRNRIDEAAFYELIGQTTVAAANQRRIPLFRGDNP